MAKLPITDAARGTGVCGMGSYSAWSAADREAGRQRELSNHVVDRVRT
jgi:hypothetical protein